MGSREDWAQKFRKGFNKKSDADLNDEAQDYARKNKKKKTEPKKKDYFSGIKKLFNK